MIREIGEPKSLSELLGHEGRGAALFWPAFGHMLDHGFTFSVACIREPTDPVNILLNVTASLLARDITVALDRAGLHPGFGALHATEDGRDSAVYDLMEEFRASMCESVVAQTINFVPSHRRFRAAREWCGAAQARGLQEGPSDLRARRRARSGEPARRQEAALARHHGRPGAGACRACRRARVVSALCARLLRCTRFGPLPCARGEGRGWGACGREAYWSKSMADRPMLMVYCYDIVSDRVRARVAAVLEETAVRVQDSVFEARLGRANAEALFERVARLLDDGDSLRMYAVSRPGSSAAAPRVARRSPKTAISGLSEGPHIVRGRRADRQRRRAV